MLIVKELSWLLKIMITNLISVSVLILVGSTTSLSADETLPMQIKDLRLGTSSAQVIDKIGKAGSYAKEIDPRDQRLKITWQIPNSPYYKKLVFGFTQKDRLYQIRFALHDQLSRELQPLKKAFLEEFHVSSEDPTKMRIKGQDVLMYMPEKGSYTFFEFTDMKTGEKWFELFSRDISFQDKQTSPKEVEQEKQG